MTLNKRQSTHCTKKRWQKREKQIQVYQYSLKYLRSIRKMSMRSKYQYDFRQNFNTQIYCILFCSYLKLCCSLLCFYKLRIYSDNGKSADFHFKCLLITSHTLHFALFPSTLLRIYFEVLFLNFYLGALINKKIRYNKKYSQKTIKIMGNPNINRQVYN